MNTGPVECAFKQLEKKTGFASLQAPNISPKIGGEKGAFKLFKVMFEGTYGKPLEEPREQSR